MRKKLVALLCLLAAGCASEPQLGQVLGSVLQPAAPFYGEAPFAVGKDYLTSSQTLSSTVKTDRPRAFVLLGRDQTNANRKVCRAFEGLSDTGQVGDANPAAKVVSTYWLLTTSTVQQKDCNWLVANYDFGKAAALRSAYRLPSASGQYILGIDQNNQAFYIDITKANDRQRADAMQVWLATAQTLAPEGAGTAITSNNLFDRLAREFCGGNIVRDVSAGDVIEAAGTMSPVAIGRVAINAAGGFFCERRA